MTQPLSPIQPRRHMYPDRLYGETPRLMLPHDNPAATNLARLMVKLGVDGRGPRAEAASIGEWLAGRSRLRALHRAAAAAGFMVDARFDTPDESAPVRAQYMYKRGEVGLLVADRPPYTSGRISHLSWVLRDDSAYEPVMPAADGEGGGLSDLEAYANAYDTLWSRTVDAYSESPLTVVYARLNAYYPLPSPSAAAAGRVVPQG